MIQNKSPQGSVAPSSRFSTPSRRSLGRLTNAEHRGRVKGMIQSFESSGRSREGSLSSDFSSAGDENAQLVATEGDVFSAPQPDLEEALVPAAADDEEEEEAEEEEEPAEADVTITSPVAFSEELPQAHETLLDFDSDSEHQSDELETYRAFISGEPADEEYLENSQDVHDWPKHPEISGQISPLFDNVVEPSIEQLIENEGDAEDNVVSHPWEDEAVGETARRVPVLDAAPRKSSPRHSHRSGSLDLKAGEPLAPLAALFIPLPESDTSFEEDGEDDQSATQVDTIPHTTAPPSYTDQGVEADLTDLDEAFIVQQTQPIESPSPLPPNAMEIIESLRSRLAEVEERLAKMEQREAQRALADQEEIARLREMAEASSAALLAASVPAAAAAPVSLPPSPSPAPDTPPEMVSVGISTHTSEPSAPKVSQSKFRIPKTSRETPPAEFFPDGIPQFIIGASLGIFVVVAQTIFRRYSGKRT